MIYCPRPATATEFLASMIDIHGERVTHTIDDEDDNGSIVWFDSHAAANKVADRLGAMVHLFDGTAIYVHPQFVSALFRTEGA